MTALVWKAALDVPVMRLRRKQARTPSGRLPVKEGTSPDQVSNGLCSGKERGLEAQPTRQCIWI